MIRVLVVDDSPVIRERVRLELDRAAGLQVCGVASSGRQGVRLAVELQPDVVLMDLSMPDLDGFEATREIMHLRPVPVIALTAMDAKEVSRKAFECGAAEFLQKDRIGPEMCELVRLMAGMKVVGLRVRERAPRPALGAFAAEPRFSLEPPGIALVGASTGGPQALQELLSALPEGAPVAYAVVQHIARGFLQPLVGWLAETTRLRLRIAKAGDRLEAGTVLFAPDDWHLLVGPNDRCFLDGSAPVQGVRPSVDALFKSGRFLGPRALGLLMTGMGSDGAEGLRQLREAGATTLTQSEESSIIYGMPAAAVRLGASQQQVSPREAAKVISLWAARFPIRRGK